MVPVNSTAPFGARFDLQCHTANPMKPNPMTYPATDQASPGKIHRPARLTRTSSVADIWPASHSEHRQADIPPTAPDRHLRSVRPARKCAAEIALICESADGRAVVYEVAISGSPIGFGNGRTPDEEISSAVAVSAAIRPLTSLSDSDFGSGS